MSAAPRPQPRRERLTSLKDAGKNRPVGALTPRNNNNNTKSKKQGCCANPSPLDMDGTMVCENCGNLISESNIVSEVTFGETSGGAAMVEGGFVGNDQRHANTMGTAGRRIGLGGSEGKSTAESNGRDAIRGLMTSMRINNEHIEQSALGVYKLACSFNFVHGRRPATLAACCLYYACRMKPGNTQLLIDFAEKIKVNVFKLGDTYKALLEKLFIEEPGRKSMYGLLEPEPLIQKYVDKLEFGPVGGRKVADDAVKLLRRMRRDWMVDGRQPAGVCGACIILAARMNNFRRTVREVVYVVKVADMTINKRLIEFKRTQSGRLTVDQFRTHGERLVGEKEPPAVYFAREKEAKRRRLMQQANDLDAILQPRLDADGFAIPSLPASASALPIDPNLLAASNLAHAELQAGEEANKPKKRGRPPKPKGPAPPVADEDIEVEQELEQEIDKILHDSAISDTINDIQFNEIAERSKRLADEIRGSHTTSESAVVEDTEFDDDPEVANCLLSPAEIEIKEKIWVTHNADWLRHEQAKKLKQALEEANGGPKKRVVRKRKQRQIGDLSDYNRDSPASTVGEAAQQMMQRRGKGFSRAINYEKLNAVMKPLGGNNESSSESQPSSSRPSNAPSPAPSDASAMTVEDDDDDDDHATGLPTPAATQQTQQQRQQQVKNTIVVDDAEDDASEDEADDDAQEEIDETVDSVAMYGLHDNGEFGGEDDEGIYAQDDWEG
ncbi:transcription initiation factor TFIIIB, Brf1 subunit [Phyllosticta citribraziliensis]|uniref:Transcription initiation factor TFIIIB, Brf1 subunit n=1 Tax=Phyllosticta citribraziliensis TaxID=989973 RepID=A0ABR1LF51_9PEZI